MDETARSYAELRVDLERRRDELLNLYEAARFQLNEQVLEIPGDAGDESSNDQNADYFYKLTTKHQQQLAEIRDALDRLDRGVFGSCQSCEQDIGVERLKRMPSARLCIDCQQLAERRAG